MQRLLLLLFFFFFFFAGRALYKKFRNVFGLIFTQIDAAILIFIKACCWNTLFILLYSYYIIFKIIHTSSIDAWGGGGGGGAGWGNFLYMA